MQEILDIAYKKEKEEIEYLEQRKKQGK